MFDYALKNFPFIYCTIFEKDIIEFHAKKVSEKTATGNLIDMIFIKFRLFFENLDFVFF